MMGVKMKSRLLLFLVFMLITVGVSDIMADSIRIKFPDGTAPASPVLVIDVPQHGSVQSGIGLIHGWVCGGGQVTVSLDDQPFATITADAPRWDVARAFPECGPTSGFGLPMNWSNIEPGSHSLTANGVTVPFHVGGFGGHLDAGQVDFSQATLAPGFDDTFWLYGVAVEGQETNLLYRWEPSIQGLSVLSVEPEQTVPNTCFSPAEPTCDH